jgi:hypothetical protein
MNAETEFWTSGHRYEALAREYEQNIEWTHPSVVTSKRLCPCLEYVNECRWAATSVTYYEYRGPSVQNR